MIKIMIEGEEAGPNSSEYVSADRRNITRIHQTIFKNDSDGKMVKCQHKYGDVSIKKCGEWVDA